MYIIIKINSIEESRRIQQLCFDYDIGWYGNTNDFYRDSNCIYLIKTMDDDFPTYRKGLHIFDRLSHINPSIIKEIAKSKNIEFSYNFINNYEELDFIDVYDISKFWLIENYIKFGKLIPNYKPKKIIREI